MTLAAHNVSFRYPGAGADALRDVSVTLPEGMITAIVGPNGAGKSTLFRLLAGLEAPRDGEVRFGDQVLTAMPPLQRARSVAIAAQDPERPEAWTALEVVLMGRSPHLGGRQFESTKDVDAAREALAALDAEHLADDGFGQLSGGEQQRVLLARALCQDTHALLLDEPTSHLDPRQTVWVAQLCRRLADRGRIVCCVLHDLNLASQLADHLIVMTAGQVVAEGAPSEVLTEEMLAKTYGVDGAPVEQPQGPPLIAFKGLSGRD